MSDGEGDTKKGAWLPEVEYGKHLRADHARLALLLSVDLD